MIPEKVMNRIDEDQREYMQIPDGWENLVSRLDEDLNHIDPNYKVIQIKAKFGGLRYYVGWETHLSEEEKEFAQNVIFDAEQKSFKLCEYCGEPGQTAQIKDWQIVACASCFHKKL